MTSTMNLPGVKSGFSILVLISTILVTKAGFSSELSVQNLKTGQYLSLEERMALCGDARELRTKLLDGRVYEFKVQCKIGQETLTIELDDREKIHTITHRTDYEAGISPELIEKLRSDQVARYGQPVIESHKLPGGFSGEVWQYGWGENCIIDSESKRISPGESSGPCLVIDTDLTASKKLLVEYVELIDPNLEPAYISSKNYELELYSTEKGARILNFSGASKSE